MAVADVAKGPSFKNAPAAVLLAAALMLAGAGASVLLTPKRMLADEMPAINLESIVPQAFGDWKVDTSLVPVLPDPTVQSKLDELYSQTLNRTFVNSRGQRIMLSIAYGRNQNSESTAAHRPEFCYVSQGFTIQGFGQDVLHMPSHDIKVVRLLATADRRVEPITYWVTLGDEASVPGLDRKLQQLRFGLQGLIVDGMLFRVSSLSGDDPRSLQRPDYSLHDQFVADMAKAMPASFRTRFFGS